MKQKKWQNPNKQKETLRLMLKSQKQNHKKLQMINKTKKIEKNMLKQ